VTPRHHARLECEGTFVGDPKGKAAVQRAFKEIASGLSTHTVANRLNSERGSTLSGTKVHRKTGKSISKGWSSARISQIVRSDFPRGWFQPHRREGNKRIPVGEPIKHYYPASPKSLQLAAVSH